MPQVKKCLKNLGVEAKSDELIQFTRKEDGSEEANEWSESSFLSFAAMKVLQRDKAFKAFELMDRDGKGVVVLEDLQRVAEELGEDITPDELREMVEAADRCGEGLLSPKDFVRLARKVNL